MRSSKTYYLSPVWLREEGFEVNRMTRENCYAYAHTLSSKSLVERQAHYDQLSAQIQDAGELTKPIVVAINRKGFGRDKILDGHHRLNIAIEQEIELVPVQFESNA